MFCKILYFLEDSHNILPIFEKFHELTKVRTKIGGCWKFCLYCGPVLVA